MGGGPPGFPQGFTCPVVLRILSGLLGFSSTGVLPSMPELSSSLRLNRLRRVRVLQPQLPKELVWALPSSLAATGGIEVSFSSSGYLDVSVHRVSSSVPMCSAQGDGVLPPPGCPIRVSPDRCLLAAPRSFSQLATPFFAS